MNVRIKSVSKILKKKFNPLAAVRFDPKTQKQIKWEYHFLKLLINYFVIFGASLLSILKFLGPDKKFL